MFEDVIATQRENVKVIEDIKRKLNETNGSHTINELDDFMTISLSLEPCGQKLEDIFNQLLIARTIAQVMLNLFQNFHFYKSCTLNYAFTYHHSKVRNAQYYKIPTTEKAPEINEVAKAILVYIIIRKLLRLSEGEKSQLPTDNLKKKQISVNHNGEVRVPINTVLCLYCDTEVGINDDRCNVCEALVSDFDYDRRTAKLSPSNDCVNRPNLSENRINKSGDTAREIEQESLVLSQSTWICSKCTITNNNDRRECRNCSNRRDKAVIDDDERKDDICDAMQTGIGRSGNGDERKQFDDESITAKRIIQSLPPSNANNENVNSSEINDTLNESDAGKRKRNKNKDNSAKVATNHPIDNDEGNVTISNKYRQPVYNESSTKHDKDISDDIDTWSCSQCTFKNSLETTHCSVCHTGRDGVDANNKGSDKRWERSNDKGSIDKLKQNQKNDGAGKTKGNNQIIERKKADISDNIHRPSLINTWPCSQCSFYNSVENNRCSQCNNDREGANVTMTDVYKRKNRRNINDIASGNRILQSEIPGNKDKRNADHSVMNYTSLRSKPDSHSDPHIKYGACADTDIRAGDNDPQSLSDQWPCPSCSFNNRLEDKCCAVCYTFKPTEALNEDTVWDATDIHGDDVYVVTEAVTETWKCKQCSTDNLFDKYICGQCHKFAPFFNKWVCNKCFFYNDQMAPQCSVCNTKNVNLIKCLKCKVNTVNVNVARECDSCTSLVKDSTPAKAKEGTLHKPNNTPSPQLKDTTAASQQWIEVKSKKCATCNNKITANEGRICKKCVNDSYYCMNRRCGSIVHNRYPHCRQCKLKKGSIITDHNMAEVHNGNKYAMMWQCTACASFNTAVNNCAKCKNLRCKGVLLKKCDNITCNWINRQNTVKCDKCCKILKKK